MNRDEQTQKRLEQELYLQLSPTGELRIGTCEHCVLSEPGRPDRAWSAEGDRELDFPRDELLRQLALLGVHTTIVEEYVCP